MDAKAPTPVSTGGLSEGASRTDRRVMLRRLYLKATITFALLILCIVGLTDRSIRTDPFTPDPGFLEWLFKLQPDPRLALMPVVPMGAAGVLSWRPKSTAWLTERPVGLTDPAPQRAAFHWLGFEAARAGEPDRKVAPKTGPIAPNQAEPSKIPNNPVQQSPIQQQPSIESKDSKVTAPRAPQPAAVRLVPDPSADPNFARLPARQPLSEGAYWAGCDKGRTWCLRLAGIDGSASRDGGQSWKGFPTDLNPAPFIAVDGEQPLLVPARNAADGSGSIDPMLLTAVDARVPFALSGYAVDDEIRGYRAAAGLNAKLQGGVREFLRTTSSRMNFFALLPPDQEVELPRRTARMFTLFAQGHLAATTFKLFTPAGQVQHETQFVTLPTNANPTKANLRSLHFQPDQRFGWISSGWEDGNEEGPLPAVFQTSDGGKSWERLSYRWQFAPWVLFGALPGLALAFFFTGLAWHDLPRSKVDEGISATGTSDTPIGWNDFDVLGMKPLALALSRFVRNTSTSPPLTIAITGPWGTGKSSLMNLVAEDLRQRGSSPVWFNAWHHQKEENILAALLENIRGQAIPSVWRLSGLWFRARLLYVRAGRDIVPLLLTIAVIFSVAWAFKWAAIGNSLAAWLKPDAEWPKLAQLADTASSWLDHALFVGAGTLLLVIVKIYATMNLKPSELMATLRGNSKLADFSAQLGFRYKFAKEFDAAGRALRTSTSPGLVIFIDDLDRCTPANLMEVLESINFLTTAGPCFIFLGMDEPKVVEIIAKQYGDDQQRARQYLKKLLNLTIPVPDVDVRNSVGLSFGHDERREAMSPWPDRIRRTLRYVPDVGIPAMALLLMIWLLASWANNLQSVVSPPPAKPPQATAAPASAATEDAASAAPNLAPERRDDANTAVPVASADQLVLSRRVPPYLGLAVALLLIALLAARRVTMVREDKVEDSKHFRTALAIWHPAVFEADPTPRGVKRHQNRLRLQAMRLRPAHETSDVLDRWFDVKPARSSGADISEPTLVALGGIVALCDDIPDWSVQPPSAATSGLPSLKQATIAECVSAFKAKFPSDWPPTPEAIAAFRALRRSL
ncbi:P-loop NTPase fold protein [Bradyrhizobium cosmicum]|uniref:KAP family P-loop NTPase fold protein n=1 Tax=Bradyrhizobium cosmicum TaxID=1404864 RepID=UPI0028E29D1E|nr:P-loop NTPase fold protein [Bradyrhizobium cosmicum]